MVAFFSNLGRMTFHKAVCYGLGAHNLLVRLSPTRVGVLILGQFLSWETFDNVWKHLYCHFVCVCVCVCVCGGGVLPASSE